MTGIGCVVRASATAMEANATCFAIWGDTDLGWTQLSGRQSPASRRCVGLTSILTPPAVGWTASGKRLIFSQMTTRIEWARVWPHRGTPLNWDAVGQVKIGAQWEWLLIEAKAHLDEVSSTCGAMEIGGRPLIRRTLDRVKKKLGVDPGRDWLCGYYQYCNRIAVLDHLLSHAVPTHLLWIYFTGDRGRDQRICPKDELGWQEVLRKRTEMIGLPEKHTLSARMHKLYLPVCPNT